jgi:hypothetical protein
MLDSRAAIQKFLFLGSGFFIGRDTRGNSMGLIG